MSERKPIEKEFAGKNLDIHDRRFTLDPYPEYRRLRAECPVKHSELYGGFWLLTRYEDVRSAAIDWKTFTSSVPGVTAIPIITRRTEPQLPLELDPPKEARPIAVAPNCDAPGTAISGRSSTDGERVNAVLPHRIQHC